MTTGDLMRSLRTRQGMSLREMGKRSGVTFSYLWAIERGTKSIDGVTLGHVRRIAAALNVPVMVLINADEAARAAAGQGPAETLPADRTTEPY